MVFDLGSVSELARGGEKKRLAPVSRPANPDRASIARSKLFSPGLP